jgi:polyhydroxyalkanoate synthase
MNPFDPFGWNASALAVWKGLAQQPNVLAESQARLAEQWLELFRRTVARSANASADAAPVAAPAAGDRRFSAAAWTENPFFDMTKQAYVLATNAVLDTIARAENVDGPTRERATFYARQMLDALSPTNVAWLNPAVVEETVRTGGQNLVKGAKNLLADALENEGRVALVDTKAFAIGENVATTRGSVVFRNAFIELIQYAPTTERQFSRPLVIVPPWINKFYILDLQPANSFVKYATDQGFTTFVVSWVNPDATLADATMEDYLFEGAYAACAAARAICGSADVNAIGYCLGGTLISMLLAYLAKREETLVHAATTFAAMTDFSEPGPVKNFLTEESVAYIESTMDEKGFLPGRAMGDTFNMIRANDLIWTVAVNRYLLGKEAPAFDLLYWNNDATRMPKAMHAFYLNRMYLANDLVKPGAIVMRGTPIDLRAIANDLYIVATADDHIAPWRTVYALTQHVAGTARFRLGHSGHIAGIVSPPGGKKGHWHGAEGAAAAVNPPTADAWKAQAPKHEGSWWPDWSAWNAERSGETIAARVPGAHPEFPAIAEAPGSYVLVT